MTLCIAVLSSPGPRAAGSQSGTGAQASGKPTVQTQGAGRGASPRTQNASQRGNRFYWWKDAEVMKELGITPTLSKRIDDLFHQRLPQASAQWAEFQKQNKELDRLIRERKVGADVISVQLDRVEAQRTMVNKSRTLMHYEIYQLLTAEQYTKLVAYNERRNKGRGNSPR